ncbi:hypothetical protein [Propionivibrio dicarboxylicus]|uniref:N-acetyltransferase domain-containing protein n=1 Tax=Propionivibrio dicarboxylicus TaxID=83767 RepID=A0A1G8EK79_9RHOO|nr:hypothetical protein [Propionivibrio dicarboxylicus]SDH70240.1 hypothetical protein SAMN05660652_02108 [Propionivibrio dicarboxylicus]
MTLPERDCAVIRAELFETFSQALRDRFALPGLAVAPFSPRIFHELAKWPAADRYFPHWDWKEIHQRIVNKPCRFEAVLLLDDQPLGVAIGRPSRGWDYLGIPRLEARPGAHPLAGQIAATMISLAVLYAAEIQLPEVRLLDPIEELIDFYVSLGLSVARNADGELYLMRNSEE